MAHYKFTYQPVDMDKYSGIYYNMTDDEDAASHAKNFCDHYGHKLLNDEKIK